MAEPNDPNKPILQDLTGRIGKYEIIRPLGKGAMGQVYLAHDTVLDRDVALKVMVAQIADDPELKTRFEREARAVAKMTHPNVVTVFDLGSHADGSPFIAMELLKGQDLQKAMRQTPPMAVERKVAVIVQVLAGLAHAHQAGIVHRDIKPANIFIQEDGSVKIMDFGVARLTTASMTGTGNIVGTADYMSPEQVKGAKVDGRSDLFSVGCMLFELAAGRRPFHSDNLMAIFYKITHEEANFDLIPQGAEYDALMPILKKALAKDTEERYQTAYEFAVDLREWLKAHATTTSSQNVLEALVDLEAPTHAPMPMNEAPGSPSGGATVDLGRRGPRKGTLAPTRVAGRTVRRGRGRDDAPRGDARRSPRRRCLASSARPLPAPKPSVLPWVAVALALVAVGVAAWLAWKSQQAPPTPPATQAVAARGHPAAADHARDPRAAARDRRAGPDVRGGRGQGRRPHPRRPGRLQGGQLRPRGDRGPGGAARGPAERERAEDPRERAERPEGPRAAQGGGDRARPRRLRRGRERARGRAAPRPLGPRRRRPLLAHRRGEGPGAARHGHEGAGSGASAAGASAHTAQITDYLNQANAAMGAKQYEAAIAFYNRILEMDPNHQAALIGKTGAIGAKSQSDAAASGARPGGAVHSFVPGRPRPRARSRAGWWGSRTPPASR